LESDLRAALAADDLHMVYHPQVDRNGIVRGLEALLRWQHPQHGAISPGLFVPLAEESGLINALGEFVLRRVFAETRQWPQVRIAVNISPIQLRSPGFAALLGQLAVEQGVALGRYEIEVTETALLGDDRATADNIERLKQLGLSIALDDFGTGYSSLSVLQTYSVDRIKIDRAFVGCLGLDSNANALVAAMVQLAAALDLGIIAEGVETEDQMLRLIGCGCHEFQGHLFGEPMTGPDLTAWLAARAAKPMRPLRKRA
jgi:EAL domain-containing protein (putative c-di-GMP-specific phosphodiesterase class I)